jgi:acetyl-CoA decarbonylase/synthase complex subunit gamma
VNVWCAAAKGTFGTNELVHRIEATRVASVVSHDMLIVPQLAAVGVAAHEVHKQSGFRVLFGPVYASDVPAFLDAGFKSPEMRFVRFPLPDRLALVPVELVQWVKRVLIVALCLLFLAGLGSDGYSMARVTSVGVASAVLLMTISMVAAVLGPTLLPWLPGRAFSAKGTGLGCALLLAMPFVWLVSPDGVLSQLDLAAWCIAIPATASFITMNFTGATPFTSLSGVRHEVKRALPLQIAGAAIALVLWGMARFV